MPWKVCVSTPGRWNGCSCRGRLTIKAESKIEIVRAWHAMPSKNSDSLTPDRQETISGEGIHAMPLQESHSNLQLAPLVL